MSNGTVLVTALVLMIPCGTIANEQDRKVHKPESDHVLYVDPVTGKRDFIQIIDADGPHFRVGEHISRQLSPRFAFSTDTTFTNTTPVPIPAGPIVVSSAIVVLGIDTVLTDLQMTTFIEHTFNADLDITLTSPAGTIVTITTDNGSINDNVFNGTLWDDKANPGGQVPYSTNPGLVTDHPHANNVVSTPLVPEEAFGAFIGENPNGTWTLTISDDAAGDEGILTSWSLHLSVARSRPAVVQTSFVDSTAVEIPTGPAVVTSSMTVSGLGSVRDVNLQTFITHTFAADLDITLMSPAGTIVTITTDNGGGNDDVFNGTLWDDDANPGGQVPYTSNLGLVTDHLYQNTILASPLVPEEALAAFIGENPNGTWTLTISDDAAGDGGTLHRWSLIFQTDAVTSVDEAGILPHAFTLYQNYPNPFNPNTTLEYEVPQLADVLFEVFDLLGRKAATLVNEQQVPGRYNVHFDASDLASGVYLYRITAGAFSQTRKMILMR